MSKPDLSIVLTIVDGGETLERCLEGLSNQTGSHNLEVLVPFDHMSLDAKGFVDRFPDFSFVDLGRVLDGKIPKDDLEMHHFFDIRRSEALKIAQADLIAIIEDRGVPQPDWSSAMIELHNSGTYTAIGGAVDNGVNRIWNWAVFICDFGRFQAPLSDDDPEYVTDTNICYRKGPLFAVRNLWNDRYHESQVNWALRRQGEKMMLSDRPLTVQFRPAIGMLAMARERVHWGRMFGQVRGREITASERWKLCFGMPLLPFLLFVRHFRRQRKKAHNMKQFVAATPAILFLLVFWSIGEFIGYTEVAPKSKPAKA